MKHIITIGNFDGLHLGHRKLLESVTSLAHAHGLPSAVITFSIHPAFLLGKNANFQILIPPVHKEERLRELGIDRVQSLAFTKELSQTSAHDFLVHYLIPTFNPHTIVMGYDSHFGHGREGNLEFLKRHAGTHEYRCQYVPPYSDEEGTVSSSRIRNLLSQGDITLANRLLGAPYRLYGKVVSGRGLGRKLGFPTANLQLEDAQQLVPAHGVYLSRACFDDTWFFGLTNIGSSPTVKSTPETVVETYMLDFNQNIYDAPLQVELLQRLREEISFPNREALIAAMHADEACARDLIRDLS
ncbi:MAG: bifunctional riboflavin kinase/FAD synthetase [Candidatus Cloacimonetes bacterium]|nr:bifunctional riboflavin kinase/FAD synthetase [Candidatus Cloacimonadota bacterium]